MTVVHAQLDSGVLLRQRGRCLGHDGAQHGRVGGQPDPAGLQTDLGGEFVSRRVDSSQDLGGPIGQQLSFWVIRIPRPIRCTSLAPVAASRRERWWLTDGCE